MTETKKKKPTYEATIEILGKKYKAKGKTVMEAVSNLKPKGMARGKSILTVTKGKESKSKVLVPFVVNRLFNLSPTMRIVALKNVSTLFGI